MSKDIHTLEIAVEVSPDVADYQWEREDTGSPWCMKGFTRGKGYTTIGIHYKSFDDSKEKLLVYVMFDDNGLIREMLPQFFRKVL